ncbi:MAG TPA: hypothetical protein VK843_05960, partial [Planctomycetota bacterium]|nr:hypothetical protein [Planctomycetota bacterium]
MVYLQRALRFLPVALGVAALAIAILSQASVFHVQDDAYMYARYAANLRHGDGFAWNPGGEPTWGATALLYVPWVAAISTFLGDDPGRIIVFASAIGMVLALVLMALLVIRSIPSGEGDRGLVLMICVAIAAVAHRKIAAHAANGMDTGFSMACLCVLLLAWRRWSDPVRSQVNSSGVV